MGIKDKHSPEHQELIEKIADLEHQQWIHWAGSVLNSDVKLPYVRRKNWENRMVPYEELPEHVKELDRVWAAKVVELCSPNPKCPWCGFDPE